MPFHERHFRLVQISQVSLQLDAGELTAAINDEIERNPEALSNLAFFEGKVTYDRERRYLEDQLRSERDLLFMFRAGVADALLGTAGLHEIDRHIRAARIGVIIIDSSMRGWGFGSMAIQALLGKAFVELDLNKVYLNVFAENDRGRRLYSKLGFTEEGRLRDEYLLRGRYHDMIRMAMLKREWLTRRIT